MQASNDSRVLGATWGPSVVGVVGTVAAILTAFARIGTKPVWETVGVSVGVSLIVAGFGLLVLKVVTRSSR